MYNTKQHPLVAKRDIIVVKYLRKSPGEDVWKTPCQCTRVELNKELIPLKDRMEIRPYNSICNSITAGTIHALTVNNDRDWDGCQAFKAIIPKGTKYFVDVNGCSIVVRKLLITDEDCGKELYNMAQHLKILLDEYIEDKLLLMSGQYTILQPRKLLDTIIALLTPKMVERS